MCEKAPRQRNNSPHDSVFHNRRKHRFIIEFSASFTWIKARGKVEQFHEYLSSATRRYFDSLAQREIHLSLLTKFRATRDFTTFKIDRLDNEFQRIPSKQIYSHMQKQIVARAIKFLWGPVIKTTNYNTQAKTSHRKSRTFILISRRTFLKRASRRWKKNLLISGESAFAEKKNFSSFPYAPAINSFDVEISENNFLLRLVSRVLRERCEERRKNVSVELVMPRVGHLQVSLPSNFDQIGMDSKTQR